VSSQIASLIEAAEAGHSSAVEPLFKALYAELHWLAKCELARQGGGVSIGVTSLLHEAYVSIASRNGDGPVFPDRARFMAYAARVMRGLIVDHARNQHALKRGGAFEITSLDTKDAENLVNAHELEKISEALDELAEIDRSLAEVVDLKFFCGFTVEEIAEMKGLSERSVRRKWDKARLYLYESIRADLAA
jgi:RNA polymerase sigma factor (TIGR02999 family)